MKIVVLDGYTLNPGDNPWQGLDEQGEVEVYERTGPEDIIARCSDAEIVIVNKVKMTAEILQQLPQLKLISVTATGYDCVDTQAASEQSIPVANVPIYGTDSVAQYVLAMILHTAHRIDLHDAAVKQGEWSAGEDFSFWKIPLIELSQKTIGIVGFGRIGQRVGQLASAFGMNVLANNRSPKEPPSYQPFAWAAVEEICQQSDYIAFHCNLTPENTGMVNRDFLKKMKDAAILINTARGALIVESDLADALNSGQIGGAVLDVVANEPIQNDNPLLTAKNCLITPHLAWATIQARRRLMQTTVANVAAFIAKAPQNIVNAVTN